MGQSNYIQECLEEALALLEKSNTKLRQCENEEASEIISKTKEIFVEGNPGWWWWQKLKIKPLRRDVYPNDDAIQHFADYVNLTEECHLIIDHDKGNREPFLVFETDVAGAQWLLGEMCFVEYYIVGRAFQWLLLEDHHGLVQFVKRNGSA